MMEDRHNHYSWMVLIVGWWSGWEAMLSFMNQVDDDDDDDGCELSVARLGNVTVTRRTARFQKDSVGW